MSEKNTARRIAVARKHARALELRQQGWTLDRIKDELGFKHRASVHRAIQAEMRRVVTEPAEEMLKMELARLDALLATFWPAATADIANETQVDEDRSLHQQLTHLHKQWETLTAQKLKAADLVLKISERRAKLIGLDDYERRMAEVAERKQALDEAQAGLVAGAMMALLGRLNLTDEQQAIAMVAAPEELRRLAS